MTDTLKRDKDYISSMLVFKDGKIYTKEKTIIEFPKWYIDKNLQEIRDITYIYGIFAIIINDKYSVSIIPTLLSTTPVVVTEIEKDGEIYTQFMYGKGDCLFTSDTVVKKEILSYYFFETYYIRAKGAWFIEYEDLLRINDNMRTYAGSKLGDNYIATELVTSFIARSKKDRTVFYRQNNKDGIVYVDLINVYYSALNTLQKLSGAYFTNGLVSAIVQKEEKPSKLETLVRS